MKENLTEEMKDEMVEEIKMSIWHSHTLMQTRGSGDKSTISVLMECALGISCQGVHEFPPTQ